MVVEVNRLAPDVDDGFEPDEFRQMLESEPWRRYAERLSAMLAQESERCLAVGVDDEAPRVVGLDVPDGSPAWAQGVLDNCVRLTVPLPPLAPGSHCLKLFMVDAGVVIDRLTLASPGSADGPPAP